MDKAIDKNFWFEHREKKQQFLKQLLNNILDDGKDGVIFKAFTKACIRCVADMFLLSDKDINDLTYEYTDSYGIKQQSTLSLGERNKIKALIAYIRHLMVVNSNYETFLIEYQETNQLQILKKLLKKFLDDGKDVAIFNALTKAGIKSVPDLNADNLPL